jgi:hypothetical protein
MMLDNCPGHTQPQSDCSKTRLCDMGRPFLDYQGFKNPIVQSQMSSRLFTCRSPLFPLPTLSIDPFFLFAS